MYPGHAMGTKRTCLISLKNKRIDPLSSMPRWVSVWRILGEPKADSVVLMEVKHELMPVAITEEQSGITGVLGG